MSSNFSRFLFLDAGDTLIHLRENAGKIYYEILKSHGVVRSPDDSENVRKFFSEAWIEVSKKNPENHRDRYTGHPEGNEGYWRELIEIFLSKLDKTGLTDAVYHSILEKFDNPDTWMVDPTFYVLSEFLQKSGIGLGLISNWDLRLRGLLTRLQLLDHFKYLIISSEFGYEKPSPKIFEEAMRLSGLGGESLTYVGDKPELDYFPPRKLGWDSFVLDKNGNELKLNRVLNLGELVHAKDWGR